MVNKLKKNLKAVNIKEGDLFSSIAFVTDEDLEKEKLVATILYSSGGNIIYLHKEGYDELELQVACETFLFETINARRFIVFKVVGQKGKPEFQITSDKGKLWLNTAEGCLIRIQGLDEKRVISNIADQKEFPLIDIRILPCKIKDRKERLKARRP